MKHARSVSLIMQMTYWITWFSRWFSTKSLLWQIKIRILNLCNAVCDQRQIGEKNLATPPIQFGYRLWPSNGEINLQRRNKREILGNILQWPMLADCLYLPYDVAPFGRMSGFATDQRDQSESDASKLHCYENGKIWLTVILCSLLRF